MINRDQLATVFGIGHTIWIPGLAASLLALSLAILVVSAVGYWLVWLLTLALVIIGLRVTGSYCDAHAKWPPIECVIDRFAGVFLISCFMPLFMPSWFGALIAFHLVINRKVWPIPEVEKLMEPGPRLMLDDLIAAALAIPVGWMVYFISLMIGLY